jgi:hypothetical protein
MTGISYELGSLAKLMTAIKDFLTSIGVPLGMFAPLAWLWNQGHWSLLPLGAALLLGGHVYWLGKRLPGYQDKFIALSDLNAQKSQTYAALQRLLARSAQNIPIGKPVAPAALGASQSVSSWHTSLDWAEKWFSRHLGAEIWTYKGFNRLLLFALVYPLAFLLLTWLLTDAGQIGPLTVMPSFGKDTIGFLKRLVVTILVPLPALPVVWILKYRRQWMPEPGRIVGLFVYCAFLVLIIVLAVLSLIFFRTVDAWRNAGAIIGVGLVVSIMVAILLAQAAAVNDTKNDEYRIAMLPVAVIVTASAFATLVGVGPSIVIAAGATSEFFVMLLLLKWLATRPIRKLGDHLKAVCTVLVLLTLHLLLVVIFTPTLTITPTEVAASSTSFALILFFGLLPLSNALFDWISIGATRHFLRKISAGSHWAIGLIAVDVLLGLLLTAGLFLFVLYILKIMQVSGWGVDAAVMVTQFRANPLDPQVSWIAMLALTNMLPTLIHLVISFWGLVSRQMHMPREHVGAQVHSLVALLDTNGRFVGPAVATPQTSLILGSNGQTIAAKPAPAPVHQPISTADLNALFNYLYVDHWLVPFTVLGVVVALWSQYLSVLAWFLGLLV